METILYQKGDATQPSGDGMKIIAHICNNSGKWGKGFVLAVSKKWKKPELAYRKWAKEKEDFRLGNIQLVFVEEELIVCNMIAQEGIRRTSDSPAPIRYKALQSCLNKLAEEASVRKASVHMPRIGCGLAGGSWEVIEPMIINTLSNNHIPVVVYDL